MACCDDDTTGGCLVIHSGRSVPTVRPIDPDESRVYAFGLDGLLGDQETVLSVNWDGGGLVVVESQFGEATDGCTGVTHQNVAMALLRGASVGQRYAPRIRVTTSIPGWTTGQVIDRSFAVDCVSL